MFTRRGFVLMPVLFTGSFFGQGSSSGGSGGDAGDFLVALGATAPFYSNATFPTAFYDSDEDTTWIAFEAWTGAARMARVVPYRHATGLIGEVRSIGINLLSDDDHGVPSIVKDGDGYLHAVHGSHVTSPNYLSTVSAITGGANPAWGHRGTISGSYTYPHLIYLGGALYLFLRKTLVNPNSPQLALFKTTALSAGVPTWGSEVILVDFETDGRFYAGNILLVGTAIHITATRANDADDERKGVYYFVYDTATGNVSNFAGTTTVLAANLPVDLSTANSDFRIVDSGTDNVDIPFLAFDTDGNPHITYPRGTGGGTAFNFKHIMHDGAAWSSETTVAAITGQTPGTGKATIGTCAVIPLASGEMAFLYPDNSAGVIRGEAGSIYRKTRSAAGSWSSASLVLAKVGQPLARCTVPVNADADIRALFSEVADSADDADAGGLRIYGYGDGGLVGPGVLTFDSAASDIIDACSVAPSDVRKLTINDLVVRLKGFSLWTPLDCLWMLAAHDAQAARLNWKNPGTFDLTLQNTPSFTADDGYLTNGSNNYLDTNFNPSTAGGNYAQNSATFGIWTSTSGQSAASAAGWFDGTDGISIVPRSTADAIGGRVNQTAQTGTAAAGTTDGAGLTMLNRSGASALQFYKNGASVALTTNATQASVALNSASLRLGSITASSFAAFNFRAAVIGSSLTSTQQGSLYGILNEYMRALGL